MRRFILRLLRIPRSLSVLVFDRFLIPLWMRLNGVRYGHGCRFEGLPVIGLAPGSRIRLGHDVSINSRPNSNVAGLPHPAILATLAPQSCIEIEDNTGISGASIVAGHAITIGQRVLIGAGACIWDTDFHPLDADRRREHSTRGARGGPIEIGDEVFIGARSIILKGVSIGQRAVVGAGAVVTKDVKAGHIVAGNPARVVGSTSTTPKVAQTF
jgi:acetyltransferase-like isoleucine patch superfamily enzyme